MLQRFRKKRVDLAFKTLILYKAERKKKDGVTKLRDVLLLQCAKNFRELLDALKKAQKKKDFGVGTDKPSVVDAGIQVSGTVPFAKKHLRSVSVAGMQLDNPKKKFADEGIGTETPDLVVSETQEVSVGDEEKLNDLMKVLEEYVKEEEERKAQEKQREEDEKKKHCRDTGREERNKILDAIEQLVHTIVSEIRSEEATSTMLNGWKNEFEELKKKYKPCTCKPETEECRIDREGADGDFAYAKEVLEVAEKFLEKRGALEDLKRKFSDLEKENGEVNGELKKARMELSGSMKIFENTKKDLDDKNLKLTKELENLKKQLEDLQKQLKAEKQSNSELRLEVHSLRTENKILKDENDQLKEQVKALQNENQNLKNKNKKLVNENAKLKNDNGLLKSENADLKEQLKNKDAVIKKLNEEIGDKDHGLRAELAKAHRKIERKTEEVKELTEKVEYDEKLLKYRDNRIVELEKKAFPGMGKEASLKNKEVSRKTDAVSGCVFPGENGSEEDAFADSHSPFETTGMPTDIKEIVELFRKEYTNFDAILRKYNRMDDSCGREGFFRETSKLRGDTSDAFDKYFKQDKTEQSNIRRVRNKQGSVGSVSTDVGSNKGSVVTRELKNEKVSVAEQNDKKTKQGKLKDQKKLSRESTKKENLGGRKGIDIKRPNQPGRNFINPDTKKEKVVHRSVRTGLENSKKK